MRYMCRRAGSPLVAALIVALALAGCEPEKPIVPDPERVPKPEVGATAAAAGKARAAP